MKKVVLAVIFILSTFAVNAQTTDDLIELIKSDIKSNRKAIITQSMDFTDSESKIFWPIYQNFEFEAEKLADKRIAIMKDFGNNFDSLTSAKTGKLMKSYFSFHQDRLNLNKKYYKKYAAALTPQIAAKLMQIQNEFQLITDLQLASMMPYTLKKQ